MTEYIKKSDAIEAFNGADLEHYCDPDAAARETIEDLPAAEVVSLKSFRELERQFVRLGILLADKIQAEKNRGEEMAEVVPVREVKLKKFKVDEIPDEWKLPGDEKPAREKIYIAGPVTGVEGYEAKFERAAAELRAKGYEPVNPVGPGLVEGWTYRDYINRGFEMLMDCDGILLLPGFMESKGAALELHYALAVGMEPLRWNE